MYVLRNLQPDYIYSLVVAYPPRLAPVSPYKVSALTLFKEGCGYFDAFPALAAIVPSLPTVCPGLTLVQGAVDEP